jgi:hypothetical protein
MYYDSSDDEDNVTTNSYEGVPLATSSQMITGLTVQKLKNIRSEDQILGRNLKKGQSHQHLLQNPAIVGKKKPGGTNRSASKFPAALQTVTKVLDGLPSSPQQQSALPDTIVPSFRGILWQPDINPMELFFSTRVQWVDEHQYSSKVFAIAKVNITQHTLSKFANDKNLCARYKDRDLSLLDVLKPNQLSLDNIELIKISKKLKILFDYADLIKKPFPQWFSYFPTMRNCKKLEKSDCSLSEILSYIYVNNYDYFKEVFRNFDEVVASLNEKKPGVVQFKKQYIALQLTEEELESGIPYLSEGQIPRHSLLYSFGIKVYSTEKETPTVPFYEQNCKPKASKSYLGKVFVSQNPHSLFQSEDKAVYIPGFDAAHGGGVIAKTIIGELEIQSRAANLQGTIKKDVNTKLPKFNHTKAPARYQAKYGLDEKLYKEFKSTFDFLMDKNEYGKLSWIYLETVLLAHLIQFHEIQLYKYSNKMARDMGKEIFWVDRKDKERKDPFPSLPATEAMSNRGWKFR